MGRLQSVGSPFDHSTLQRFDSWLMAEHPRLIFDEIARQIGQAHQKDRQFVDTYAMIARTARADLIDRLRGASERLLKAVKAKAADAYTHLEASLNLEQLYGPAKEKPTGC